MQSTNGRVVQSFFFAWDWADSMFAMLKGNAIYSQPIPLRHPSVFYYGHLPAFAWNQIFRFALKRPSLNEEFDHLFERGIDPADLGPIPTTTTSWPQLGEIAAYKGKIQDSIIELITTVDLDDPCNGELRNIVSLVLEHYLMHIETFFYMQHQLPYSEKLELSFDATDISSNGHKPGIVRIPAGTATLGTCKNDCFHWCNEAEELKVDVAEFNIDKYPVTNRQYLEFIEAGGYQSAEFWHPEAWEWIRETSRLHPQFWQKNGRQWLWKDMFALIPLPEDWPVWVSHAEAEAYTSWKQARLPSEPEFHRAAYGTTTEERLFPWGNTYPDYSKGNFGLHRLSPVAVASYPQAESFYGVSDLVGNGWEWTGTKFAPLPGFLPLPSYPGYSSDFFDGKHYVLKGGSPLTSYQLLRRSFRNWFQPHYPYVYGKFRCVYV